ncbi:hypothetical protein [Rhodococcus opacus]|uniref:hypothetical protein n=1 Tax=Rhodococcus opacus TaxID=37919 RepID=UPI001F2174F1|nr:hypothetical protein [Rhodococcus opacus]
MSEVFAVSADVVEEATAAAVVAASAFATGSGFFAGSGFATGSVWLTGVSDRGGFGVA